MYDALTGSYTFSCPTHGETRVRLSRFRRLEELPGPRHPAVYRIEFGCGCGGEHPALVSHDELDWAPLGLSAEVTFVNLMTSRVDSTCDELTELAAARIGAGEWPWSFFCWPEERPRPVFPSAFRLLAPTASGEHVDVPFHNDRSIGVVEHLFEEDARAMVEEFRAELYGASFDARRLTLE